MNEQEKAYIHLNRYFLSLQHKLEKYRMSGMEPPEYLLQHFEDAKRKLRISSMALENKK